MTFTVKTVLSQICNPWNSRSTKRTITKDRNGENVSHLEIIKVVLVHYNIVSNDYQHDSKVFYTFVSNTSFGQFLDISP